jgi:hypothetical protein
MILCTNETTFAAEPIVEWTKIFGGNSLDGLP